VNYIERLTLELESLKSQRRTLNGLQAEYACREIEGEIERLTRELDRYKSYEIGRIHQIYTKSEN
jgi:hypothetical protein